MKPVGRGRLQYISHFITKLISTCGPIYMLLRKNETHTWNEECQKAFKIIKEYLLHPPILVPPEPKKTLVLYLSIIKDVVGSMLAHEDNGKNERLVYYLSKWLHDYENRYTPKEKSCFALVWAIQKLRHI